MSPCLPLFARLLDCLFLGKVNLFDTDFFLFIQKRPLALNGMQGGVWLCDDRERIIS